MPPRQRPTPAPEIELRGVSFAYAPADAPALRGITLAIDGGEAVGVVGVNGAGKSTLVRLLNGLLRPTEGAVVHRGRDIRGVGVGELAGDVAVVLQDPRSQLFARTVREELAFGPRNLGRPEAHVAEVVDRVAARLGLADVLATSPFELPMARRRLVAIASVLAMEPRVVVLDEPATGADEPSRTAIAGLLGDLRAAGTTWVCVSHDLGLLAATASRLLVLDGGRLIADGTVRDVLADHDRLERARLAIPQATRLAAALPVLAGRPAARTADEVVGWLRATRAGGPAT
jgi:energy-coupling factor transporter ATP-binding protein EcfA2